MNHLGLFIAGVLVTLTVVASLALLVWGAILDGREQAQQRVLRYHEELAARRSRRQPDPFPGRVPPRAA